MPRPTRAQLQQPLPFADDAAGFDYRLVRSRRRRTIGIVVRDGAVTVRMPHRLAERHAHAFVDQKREWIAAKLAEQRRWAVVRARRRWATGERLPLLDGELLLRVERVDEWAAGGRSGGGKPRARRHGDELVVRLPGPPPGGDHGAAADAVRTTVIGWYRRRARAILTERTHAWAAEMGVVPGRIAIRDTRSRWGSCSRAGNLNFCWRIVLAPGAVVDYLVVHELAHLVELNHSPRYWAVVARALPGYAAPRRWLREHGPGLEL